MSHILELPITVKAQEELLMGIMMTREKEKQHTDKLRALKTLSQPIIVEPITSHTFNFLIEHGVIAMSYMHPNHYIDIYTDIWGKLGKVSHYKFHQWSNLLLEPSEEIYLHQLQLHRSYLNHVKTHPHELLVYGGEVISRFFSYKDWQTILKKNGIST